MRLLRGAAQAWGFKCEAICGIPANRKMPDISVLMFARQRAERVKLVVGEVRSIVTLAARRLPDEQDQASFLLVGQRLFISSGIAVKSGVRRYQSALEGGNGSLDIRQINRTRECRAESLPVFWSFLNADEKCFWAGHTHLVLAKHRHERLFFEALNAAIPKLYMVVG